MEEIYSYLNKETIAINKLYKQHIEERAKPEKEQYRNVDIPPMRRALICIYYSGHGIYDVNNKMTNLLLNEENPAQRLYNLEF